MEFIHKKKAEVQRTKMLSDQAVARRERTKEKRNRREQRIRQKNTEFLGKQQDDDDTNVAVQQVLEQQAQTAVVTPASQLQREVPSKTATKQEKKQQQPKQEQPKQQQPKQQQPQQQTQQKKK
jgi:hypothetical protein